MFEPKKRCNKCGVWKYEGEFYVSFDPRRAQLSVCGYCNSCFTRQKKDATGKDAQDRNSRNWRYRHRHKHLIGQIRRRSEQKGYAFDLTEHIDLIGQRMDVGVCEMSGVEFDFVQIGKPKWNSPSIDRIKPELGYVYSNIRIICHGLNAALGWWGEEATSMLMTAWLDQRKQK